MRGAQKIALCIAKSRPCSIFYDPALNNLVIDGDAVDAAGVDQYENFLSVSKPIGMD